jgi:branched-chain amino acid transport system permease protein
MAPTGLVMDTGGPVGVRRALVPLSVSVAAVGAWAIADHVLAKGLPPGILFLGLVYGSLYSLSAVGLVLIYRSSRVVNFAQAQLGLFGGVVTALLAAGHGLNFYLSLFFGVLVAGVTGAVTHMLVIHRLRRSSRLLVAVATIGLSQALAGFVGFVPSILCGSLFGACSVNQSFNLPLNTKFSISPVIFNGADVMTLVVVAVVLLVLWAALRFTYWGQAMRGSAENRERAVLLGIRVFSIDVSVWVVAAVLSAVTLVLYMGVFGYSPISPLPTGGDDILLRVLAAAVIGGMESLPRTVLAAVLLGLYDAGATWTSANIPFVDATLVVIIVVALLLQHRRFTRSGDDAGSNWLTVRQFKPVPRVLSRLPEVRWARRIGALGILFVLIDAPHFLPLSSVYLLSPLLIYGIVGLSLVVLSGWAGQISLGQFGLAGLGGGVTGFLVAFHSWNWLAAIALGVLAAAAAAFLIGLPALRIRGPFLAVTTFAFAVAMYEYILPPQWFPSFVAQSVNRPTVFGHHLFGSDPSMYYLCLAAFVVVALSLWSFRRSVAGRSLIATRDNEIASEAMALPTTRIRLTAFVLSGAVAGLAGALFVMDQGGVFYASFSADTSVLLFTMAVVGGLGSISGVVFGVVYIWGVQYLLPPNWGILVSGLGIVILLLFLPEGLAGLVDLARDGVLRRIALYRRLDVPELLPAETRRDEPEDVEVVAPTALEGLVG